MKVGLRYFTEGVTYEYIEENMVWDAFDESISRSL